MPNYLLIDGNSLGHYANNSRPLTLGDMPVQAIYGFLRTLRATLGTHPTYQPVVLWDGMPWRHKMFPDYKGTRDKADTPHEVRMQEQRKAYQKQRPYIRTGLKLLGVPQVEALNMEADDLGAILADRYSQQGKVVLFTGDKDWIQLVGPKVVWRDFINDRTITHLNFEEMTGVADPRQFVEVKALAGDSGDNIAGVGGVGEKGAKEFVNKYGSFNSFLNMVTLEKTVNPKKLPKKFRDLIEDESKAIILDRNLQLMDLRTPKRPKPEGLYVERGHPSAAGFRTYCDRLLFQSISQNLDVWLSVFPAFKPQA